MHFITDDIVIKQAALHSLQFPCNSDHIFVTIIFQQYTFSESHIIFPNKLINIQEPLISQVVVFNGHEIHVRM